MKVLGIVAEYNPFHNGHKYHIEQAKKLTNSDYVIIVMSGSFTQQGRIAIYNKFERSKLAINNGADLVIELPTIYAVASAEYFSYGAINLLDKLGIVDTVCFGSEIDDINILENIANNFIENEDNIWNKLKIKLKDGESFAKSRENVLREFLNEDSIEAISKSNNILALEYIKAIKKLNSNMKPYLIKRLGNDYNDNNISKNEYNFVSATSIRKCIKNKDIELVKDYIPNDTYNLIQSSKACFDDSLFHILKYKILSSTKHDLSKINEISEGLENKVITAAHISNTYSEFVENIKSKRYVESRIRRILTNILLNISKEDLNNAIRKNIAYGHILSISKNGKKLLSELSKTSKIPILTSISDNILSNKEDIIIRNLKLDILASNIHSMLSELKSNMDYSNKL
ncbi:MAG: nucleotidyltransferase [Clostridia bacterium]|nr:nucleotidyltransferase [Clostridia bacterium]